MSQEKKTLVDSLLLPEQLERNKLIKGEQGSIPPESAFKDVQTHFLIDAIESVLNPAKSGIAGRRIAYDFDIELDREHRTTNQSDHSHGHDISTNGRGHKKVVTGKAGNKYPVPKRRGVK